MDMSEDPVRDASDVVSATPKVVRFEPLAPHQLEAILRIEQEANPAPWSEKSFTNELSNPQSVFWVLLGDGKVVGYGGYWRCIDEAHITTVAISAASRRKGLGKRLMDRLLTQAVEEGMTCSTLEVRASNAAAIQMYERMGYQITAKRKAYYPDNREDALVMWLYDLSPWAS